MRHGGRWPARPALVMVLVIGLLASFVLGSSMDPVQQNLLLTRIAVFLFGCTIWLAVLGMGLNSLREAPTRIPQSRHGCWGIGVAMVAGAGCIIVPWLPGANYHPTAYEIRKQSVAPLMVVLSGAAFLVFAGVFAYEVVMTVRWLLAGRPRPPADPRADAWARRHDPRNAHLAPMGHSRRARKRLRASQQQQHDPP